MSIPPQSDDLAGNTTAIIMMVQQLKKDYQYLIYGNGSTPLINNMGLSAGAKINRLFHKELPFDILSTKYDEKTLKKEIAYVIRNSSGVRGILCPPMKVFEIIVKKPISQLIEPCLRCVDLVMEELSRAIHASTDRMARYPYLKEEMEYNLIQHIHACEHLCKEQIIMLNNIEQAYINVTPKHYSDSPNVIEPLKNSDNVDWMDRSQIVLKGYLGMANHGKMRGGYQNLWFVLTKENIHCFKDNKESEKKFSIKLIGLTLKEEEKDLKTKKHTFILFNPNGQNIFKDLQKLELCCESQIHADSWRASFQLTNVYLENATEHEYENKLDETEENLPMTPEFHRQIEMIFYEVDSYMKIVRKHMCDMVPKIITKLVINSTRDYIYEELSELLQTKGEQSNVMYDIPKDAIQVLRSFTNVPNQ